MKRIPVALCLLAFFLFGASPVFAGGIENKPNFSAEWIRTLNRMPLSIQPIAPYITRREHPVCPKGFMSTWPDNTQ
jgi:EamA domain-containing membrane protein RarD